jgi:predicted ATP-dependent endonuclease of OLD family
MKLIKGRLKNFRSIKDSGEFWLQQHDGITVLAGQNESGKSSILKLLYAFTTNELDEDDLIAEDVYSEIELTFSTEKAKFNMPDWVPGAEQHILSLSNIKEFTIKKTFISLNEHIIELDSNTEKTIDIIIDFLDKHTSAEFNDYLRIENDTPKITFGYVNIERSRSIANPFEDRGNSKTKDKHLAYKNFIQKLFIDICPKFIMFNSQADILPKKIFLGDLGDNNESANGYKAVRNIEKILETGFVDWDSLSDKSRGQKENKYTKILSTNFKEYWSQKINFGEDARLIIQYNQGTAGGAYINFFIESQEGVWLSPNQRSDGFKWFLSFYLELKARNANEENYIILLDEPGLFLHAKAQLDMLKVLEETSNRHQIIYTTHSPYLIQDNKIHRVRLVYNNESEGTTIEKLTTSKTANKKEALKPIVDAMGLKLSTEFSAVKQKNVIVEGMSDFYYFKAMQKLLNRKDICEAFVPSMGATNAHLLMELCIGWSLDWLIIFDEKGTKKEFNKIVKSFFNGDENDAKKKIYLLHDCDGVEDMFELEDLILIIDEDVKKTYSSISDFLNQHGGKELIGRLFFESVNTERIKKEKLSQKAIHSFNQVFDFIENAFKEI